MANMKEIIWLDNDGKELRREPKGRGRPRKGSVIGPDGNFYVHPTREEKKSMYYIVLDENGNELSRTPKSRGRNKPDFVQRDDGHWYKTVSATAPSTEMVVEAVP
jgi:hypothetical protein